MKVEMMFRVGRLVALCAMVIAPTSAIADNLSAAKQHYDRGTTLYDLGKYLDAAHEYEAAFDAHSDPALLFNIGQAYRLGGDNASAIRAYRSYLRRVPSAENRGEVERLLSTLTSEHKQPPTPAEPMPPKPTETRQSAPPPSATTPTPPASTVPATEASVTSAATGTC